MRRLLVVFLFLLFIILSSVPAFAAGCVLKSDGDGGADLNLTGADPNTGVTLVVRRPGRLLDDCLSGQTDSKGFVKIHVGENYFAVDGEYKFSVGNNGGSRCIPAGEKIYCRNITMTIKGGKFPLNTTASAGSTSISILQPTSCNFSGAHDPATGKTTVQGIQTAIGCFPTDPPEIIKWLLGVGAVVGGALSFLQMLWGAFQTIMSSGDPEKLKEGQETIVSAIEGILVIIFAVFILRLIGFTILKIPGFG